MKSIEVQDLAELIPLEGPFLQPEEATSLESVLVKASNLLMFEATSDDGGIIRLDFKNPGSYDQYEVSFDLTEMGIPRSKRGEDLCYHCKSLRKVVYTLHTMRELHEAFREMDEDTHNDILEMDMHTVASAIVTVLTFQGKIRVCGQFIRWSKPEFRRKDAFEVNEPLTIRSAVDFDISSSTELLKSSEQRVARLSIKIDNDARLNLFRPLRVSPRGHFQSYESFCGGKVNLFYLSNKNIDELKSEWNISYSSGPNRAEYRKIEKLIWLH